MYLYIYVYIPINSLTTSGGHLRLLSDQVATFGHFEGNMEVS